VTRRNETGLRGPGGAENLGGDSLCERDDALGMFHVQLLDELAVHDHNAFALRFGLGIGVDDAAGEPELFLGGGEDLVGG